MPGVLGGIAAGVASAFIEPHIGAYPHEGRQWAFQFAAIGCMLLCAIATGAVAGFAVRLADPAKQSLGVTGFFEDALFWEEVESDSDDDMSHAAPPGESIAVARG